jgi:hypothetical protein
MFRVGSPSRGIPGLLGSPLCASAVLLGMGCGARTALLDRVASAVADAGSDNPVDRSLSVVPDGSMGVRNDAGSEAGRLDTGIAVNPNGWLELLAGGLGGGGTIDGIGAAARFYSPQGVACDGAGNLFVADQGTDRIRKVVIATGEVTTLAGSGQGSSDGIGAAAGFKYPYGVASDGAGNLFVADTYNHTLRKVMVATGEVTTLAGAAGKYGSSDGIGAAAGFGYPQGVAGDGTGNLFVADSKNHTVRKVVVATGEVTTLAGTAELSGNADGTGAAARFADPSGIASDGIGNLFVADTDNHTIRKVVVATGEVTTFAGSPGRVGSTDGNRTTARFHRPWGVASDGVGNLFVVDSDNHTIRKVVLATGEVTTLAGAAERCAEADGTGGAARFCYPRGIACDGAGSLFVGDSQNRTIRKIMVATGEVTTLVGLAKHAGDDDGVGALVRFDAPEGVASDGTGSLFVADSGNHTIRKIVMATGEVTTFAGAAGRFGNDDGTGAAARFHAPRGIASDGAGNLFVADSSNLLIRKVVIATGEVTTLAGSSEQGGDDDGTGPAARFSYPHGIASDGAGNLFVADVNNHTIRKIVVATAMVTTLAGSPDQEGSADGTGAAARFFHPLAVATDRTGDLFVADRDNRTIRKIVIATGAVTTLAGSPGSAGSADGVGSAAHFESPQGIAIDGTGNLFVADSYNHAIRKIAISTRAVTTVVGSPRRMGVVLGPLPAGLAVPYSVALGPAGELLIADEWENAILIARL